MLKSFHIKYSFFSFNSYSSQLYYVIIIISVVLFVLVIIILIYAVIFLLIYILYSIFNVISLFLILLKNSKTNQFPHLKSQRKNSCSIFKMMMIWMLKMFSNSLYLIHYLNYVWIFQLDLLNANIYLVLI